MWKLSIMCPGQDAGLEYRCWQVFDSRVTKAVQLGLTNHGLYLPAS